MRRVWKAAVDISDSFLRIVNSEVLFTVFVFRHCKVKAGIGGVKNFNVNKCERIAKQVSHTVTK